MSGSALRRLLRRAASLPGLIFGGLLAAVIAWAVPTYLPGLVEKVENAKPIQFTLFTNPAEIDTFGDEGQVAVIPIGREPTGNPGPGCRGFHGWVQRFGGVDVGTSRLRVVLRGVTTSGPVVIERMRARIVERGQPSKGIPVSCPSAGAAAVRTVAIDLDSPDALAHYVTLAGSKPLAFTLEAAESEIFDIRASTKRCHCRWVLEVGYLAKGKQKTLVISDKGEPFETTAARKRGGAGVYSWDYTSRWFGSVNGSLRRFPTSSLRPTW